MRRRCFEEKAEYENKAKEAKARYVEAMEEYNAKKKTVVVDDDDEEDDEEDEEEEEAGSDSD